MGGGAQVLVDSNGEWVFNVGPYSGVTDISEMFFTYDNITSLDVSGWDTSKVTNMHEMFAYCTSLRSLDVSGWDVSSVTDMSYLFWDCRSLKTIRMVGCNDTTKNKIKNWMPSGCTIITE